MATAKELTELTLDDLNRRAIELRETLFKDQLKLKTGTLDNPSERTGHKRDLARILTVITAKQHGTAPKAATPKTPAAKAAPKAKKAAVKATKA